jgi:hypothetical protein
VLKPGLVKGPWTPEEDQIIINCINVRIHKSPSSRPDYRTSTPRLGRHQPSHLPTPRPLRQAGITKWSEIAARTVGRIGKQCRERWFNHLDPTLKKNGWTEEDDELLVGLQVSGRRVCVRA